jgi:hypothetical protein
MAPFQHRRLSSRCQVGSIRLPRPRTARLSRHVEPKHLGNLQVRQSRTLSDARSGFYAPPSSAAAVSSGALAGNPNLRISDHWSGRRDSNPRPQPWQGCALPLSYTRVRIPAATYERAGPSSTYAKRKEALQPSRRAPTGPHVLTSLTRFPLIPLPTKALLALMASYACHAVRSLCVSR